LCRASKCGTRTSAKPLSAGMRLKNRSNASSPPAEAPIATIGEVPLAPKLGATFSSLRLAVAWRRRFCDFRFAARCPIRLAAPV